MPRRWRISAAGWSPIRRWSAPAEILTMYMGPHDLLVNLGVSFKPGITAEQMHEAIHRIEGDLQRAYPECMRVYIEAESMTGGDAGTGCQGSEKA